MVKKKFNNKALSILLASVMFLGITPSVHTAYATEAQELTYIENVNTKKSETTPYQVSFSVVVPSGFAKDVYVVFKDANNKLYRATMRIDNFYSSSMYVGEGTYSIVEVGLYQGRDFDFEVNDSNSTFTVNAQQPSAQLSFHAQNIDNIVQEADGSFGDTTTSNKSVLYNTPFDYIKIDDTNNIYYTVEHQGSVGDLTVSGFASSDCDIILRITKPGVIGEAKFIASFNGGQTYTSEVTIQETVTANGLTYNFSVENDYEEFQRGDVFKFKTLEAFPVTNTNRMRMMVIGHPLKAHELTIDILSSGGFGKSKFTVTDKKGNLNSITDTIPEDGKYKLGDNLQIIFFEDVDYAKGNKFTSNVVSHIETIDYTPVYILFGILIIIVFIGFVGLLVKKDKPATYKIKEYKWYQDEECYK